MMNFNSMKNGGTQLSVPRLQTIEQRREQRGGNISVLNVPQFEVSSSFPAIVKTPKQSQPSKGSSKGSSKASSKTSKTSKTSKKAHLLDSSSSNISTCSGISSAVSTMSSALGSSAPTSLMPEETVARVQKVRQQVEQLGPIFMRDAELEDKVVTYLSRKTEEERKEWALEKLENRILTLISLCIEPVTTLKAEREQSSKVAKIFDWTMKNFETGNLEEVLLTVRNLMESDRQNNLKQLCPLIVKDSGLVNYRQAAVAFTRQSLKLEKGDVEMGDVLEILEGMEMERREEHAIENFSARFRNASGVLPPPKSFLQVQTVRKTSFLNRKSSVFSSSVFSSGFSESLNRLSLGSAASGSSRGSLDMTNAAKGKMIRVQADSTYMSARQKRIKNIEKRAGLRLGKAIAHRVQQLYVPKGIIGGADGDEDEEENAIVKQILAECGLKG